MDKALAFKWKVPEKIGFFLNMVGSLYFRHDLFDNDLRRPWVVVVGHLFAWLEQASFPSERRSNNMHRCAMVTEHD